jgi:hypothetical protein
MLDVTSAVPLGPRTQDIVEVTQDFLAGFRGWLLEQAVVSVREPIL